MTAHAAFQDLNIVRVKTDPPCAIESEIHDGVLYLKKKQQVVVIRLPRDQEWHKIEYVFGNQSARMQVWTYVPVKRE